MLVLRLARDGDISGVLDAEAAYFWEGCLELLSNMMLLREGAIVERLEGSISGCQRYLTCLCSFGD